MIRHYQTRDRAYLLEIFRLNTPKYFDPNEEKDYLNYLAEKGDTYLTIEQNNQIVGGTGHYVDDQDGTGHITWIFFHPKCQRQGLGRQIVEHCHSILCQNKKVETLRVTTSQHAYRFFEKSGYQIRRTEKDHWGPGLDLYEMEMTVR